MITEDQWKLFTKAISAMSEFKKEFNRGLSDSLVGEIYASYYLKLSLCPDSNNAGFDAVDEDRKRYQIKFRNAQNVDVNNFDFDYLVLVNCNDNYELQGIWKITVEEAKKVFTYRQNFGKYQATQNSVKRRSIRIR